MSPKETPTLRRGLHCDGLLDDVFVKPEDQFEAEIRKAERADRSNPISRYCAASWYSENDLAQRLSFQHVMYDAWKASIADTICSARRTMVLLPARRTATVCLSLHNFEDYC